MIVVHVTHEAVERIGGISTAIAGLTTADAYGQAVQRTILLGPLLSTNAPVNRRLGEGGHVLYSSLDAISPPEWRRKFLAIEKTYDVGIVYGTRPLEDACTGKCVQVEVLLVDVFHANKDRLNLFKGELYKKFMVPSDQFESAWEYEEYVRLAEPGYEALKAIGCDHGRPMVILAHEYMGMPTALKAVLDGDRRTRTVFYAHEVASVRPIVEKSPGHDTMFYNVLKRSGADGRTFEQLFPSVLSNYKHPLVKAARYCDHIFAVGEQIAEELQFLDRHFRTMEIDLVFNGIPAEQIPLAEKLTSKERLRQYAENLFGLRPTWVFSHVARPVLSKGIWRDLRVLHELEPMLAQRGETAAFFMLGTLAGQRRPQDVRQMERDYGWPIEHEEGYPDLCGGEEHVGSMLEGFVHDHRVVRACLVNQWDWNHEVCGERMPKEMTFRDLRAGTDLEFGLSVYEPFGISQLEPLSFGALCVVSNVCGCVGFARRAAAGRTYENIIEADFLRVPEGTGVDQLLSLSIPQRDQIEAAEIRKLAELVLQRLPRDEATLRRRMADGFEVASRMSWQHVVQEYFLPSLGRAALGTWDRALEAPAAAPRP
jgi:glycosyltransferase involved in cell wall biosynthesis